MKDLTLEVSRAIVRLQLNNENDFYAMFSWLKESLLEQMDVNIDLKGEEAIKGQGKAYALREIISSLEDAKEFVRKVQ